MAIITPPNLDTELTAIQDNLLLSLWDTDEVADQKMKYMSVDNFMAGFLLNKNRIINGNFDIWQRQTSQTADGYGSDDRWTNSQSGSTKTHSQQSFTVGQTDVPNNPRYYSRTVVTTGSGASHYVYKGQRIEGVRTFSGKTVTLSFWAKADSSKNIATEFSQNFGTGGSPSSLVSGIGVTTHALTTSWTKFTATVSITSISGKTIGNNDDDYLQLSFWFEAGSDNNSRTNSLGNQSGTFDIAQVQLEESPIATSFEQRSPGQEMGLCHRYYWKSYENGIYPGAVDSEGRLVFLSTGHSDSAYGLFIAVQLPVRMRDVPSVTSYSLGGTSGKVAMSDGEVNASVSAIGNVGFTISGTNTGTNTEREIQFQVTADAEL